MANKLPNPRDLVLNKETKVSNGVYGRKADKRTPPKMYFEIHDEEMDWWLYLGIRKKKKS